MLRFVTAIVGVMALLVVGWGHVAQAQQRPQRGGLITQNVIRQIVVEGNNRVEPDTIRSYLTVATGDQFDPTKLDASLKTLFATGLFADVSLSRQDDTLVIKVVENPIINRIAFEGNRRIDDEALAQEVQLRARVVFTRAKVQADVKRVLELYRRSGRFAAQVEPKIIQLEQNRIDLVFEIVEGELTGIQRISFIGNEKFSDGSLRDVVRTQETAWYRVLSQDDRYDPDRVNFDRELLRRFYLSEGYADFRVVSAVAELTPSQDAFFITYTLSEGDRYKFGKIDVVTRFDKLDVEALKPLVTIREGDWYNAEEVDLSIAALTEAVGNLGYAFVDIRPNVRRDKDNRIIDLTFEIQEGPRVYVERINISGNSRTLDKVIRREFTVVEGDAFNSAKLRRSQARLLISGQTFIVGRRELERSWLGEFYAIWKAPVFLSGNLKRGDVGPAVEWLHSKLQARGLFGELPPQPAYYDEQTVAAVRSLQAAHGLVPDGIVGPESLFALISDESSGPRLSTRIEQPEADSAQESR